MAPPLNFRAFGEMSDVSEVDAKSTVGHLVVTVLTGLCGATISLCMSSALRSTYVVLTKL